MKVRVSKYHSSNVIGRVVDLICLCKCKDGSATYALQRVNDYNHRIVARCTSKTELRRWGKQNGYVIN